ncbi:glycoside hydrolase [Colletotrichum sublineola]|nr:glycoside hydrolase [Colletotrichum sublineola]
MADKTDVEAILRSLTLEEKVRLLAGRSFVEAGHVSEKGVPAIKTTDGPNGTRGAAIDGSTKAACFPAACSIAATFDRTIARRVGHALAQESKAKGARALPPRAHRRGPPAHGQAGLGDDPGVPGPRCVGDHQALRRQRAGDGPRTTVDETISERALREIYLKPFEIAIKEAKPWAIMTAYNLVNGTHCDMNEWLLREVLRGEWGWKGLVMSDWGGTNSVAEGIKAGMDIEMPGPPRIRKPAAVLDAVRKGEVTEDVIDERVRTILEWTDILPLTRNKVRGKKMALIGYAKDGLAHGGGSASVNAHYRLPPWDALHAALRGDDVTFTYAKGAHKERLLPPISLDAQVGTITGLDGQPGFSRVFYDHGKEDAGPVSVLDGYPSSAYSPAGLARTGTHYIACSGIGPTQVWVDDEVVFEQEGNCADPEGRLPVSFPARVEDAPAHGNFPGVRGADGVLRVKYAEGVFVGYRHYDRVDAGILTFPFGHGLSYTTFDYADFRVVRKGGAAAADEFEISVDVSNTGDVAGGVAMQIYAGKAEPSADTPVKGLVAFDKVRLQPGERQTVKLGASAKDLASFDEAERLWVVEAGEYIFYLGESAAKTIQTVSVALERITYQR